MREKKCLFMLMPTIINVTDAEAFILVKIRDEKDYLVIKFIPLATCNVNTHSTLKCSVQSVFK